MRGNKRQWKAEEWMNRERDGRTEWGSEETVEKLAEE